MNHPLGEWRDFTGKVLVKYGVHQTGVPVVVLVAHDETGAEVQVALDFAEVQELSLHIMQAAGLAAEAAQQRKAAVPS